MAILLEQVELMDSKTSHKVPGCFQFCFALFAKEKWQI